MRHRPRAVIVTNPPVFPALIALCYARPARAPLVLDSHISAFGLAGDHVSRRLLRLHAWLSRRVRATLVTDEELAAVVRGWGGRAEIVHEPPPAWQAPPPRPPGPRPRILFLGTFAGDEPLEIVVAAAGAVPTVDVSITGDPRKRRAAGLAAVPQNVTFPGYLRGDAYRAAMVEADAVLALSTEPNSVMRTAYEAVYALRPLIVPDRPLTRRLFPHAVHAAISPDGIAAGFREAVERHAELREAAAEARALQERRWLAQLAVLERLVAGDASTVPTSRSMPLSNA
jgi:glycosyltransferase involved in cell wall biosynthesis